MWEVPQPSKHGMSKDLSTALTLANGSKKYDYTNTEVASLHKYYDLYLEKRGNPCAELRETSLKQEFLLALETGYSEIQEGARLSKLRGKLKSLIDKCPYCGFGEVTDLDHFLPKRDYKAFSIYRFNLIPCCHKCNNIKRASENEDTISQFFHSYLGDLPQIVFLQAKVKQRKSGITVRYSVIHQEEDPVGEIMRISYQLEKLDLNNRYRPEINDFVVSLQTSLSDKYKKSGKGRTVAKFLIETANNHETSHGKNHWKTALLKALAECQQFCDGGFLLVKKPNRNQT